MPAQDKNKNKTREVEDFIADRDYTGAIAYLEVRLFSIESTIFISQQTNQLVLSTK